MHFISWKPSSSLVWTSSIYWGLSSLLLFLDVFRLFSELDLFAHCFALSEDSCFSLLGSNQSTAWTLDLNHFLDMTLTSGQKDKLRGSDKSLNHFRDLNKWLMNRRSLWFRDYFLWSPRLTGIRMSSICSGKRPISPAFHPPALRPQTWRRFSSIWHPHVQEDVWVLCLFTLLRNSSSSPWLQLFPFVGSSPRVISCTHWRGSLFWGFHGFLMKYISSTS